MTDLIPEGGIRSHRVRWLIESSNGVVPDNPEWRQVSDNITTLEWEPDATIEPRRGLGSSDPNDHFPGPEQHSLSLQYDLQAEFVDNNGDVVDISAMGMLRDADETLSGSMSMLVRQDKENDRQFFVAKGVYVETVEIDGSAGDSAPLEPNLSLMAEKVRKYDVKQPLSGEQRIAVESDDSADTSQSITVEEEGNSKSVTINLDGTNLQSSSDKLSDVDTFELSGETQGNITLWYNQSTQGSPTKDRKITEIKGKNFYQNVGDLGVPNLGSGDNNAVTRSGSFYRLQGSSVERPSNTNLGEELESVNLTIENNLNIIPKVDDITQNVIEEERDINFTATVYGRAEMAAQVQEHLGNVKNDVIWDLGDPPGKITIQSAHMTDPPTEQEEESQGVMMIDVGFHGEGLSLT